MIPYQAAIVRYRHNVSAGELVNVGVVMWLPTDGRLLFRLNERYGRLASFFKGVDFAGYRQQIRQLRDHCTMVCAHGREADSIADLLPLLLRDDASVFQWSEPLGGAVRDPDKRLDQLFAELVERHEVRGPRERRDEVEIWSNITRKLEARGLDKRIRYNVDLSADSFAHRFHAGWQNGTTQVLEPISLDYLNPREMIDRANTWSGRLHTLGLSQQFAFTGVVAGPERADLAVAFQQAKSILRRAPHVRKIVGEDNLDQVMDEIESDLAPHD